MLIGVLQTLCELRAVQEALQQHSVELAATAADKEEAVAQLRAAEEEIQRLEELFVATQQNLHSMQQKLVKAQELFAASQKQLHSMQQELNQAKVRLGMGQRATIDMLM